MRIEACSQALKLAAAVWLVLGVGGCSDRDDLGDEPMEEFFEHPPELLERYEQACEDKCALYEMCSGRESPCSCLDRDFSIHPTLCLEKSTLAWECHRTLSCEQLDLTEIPPEDDPCFGQRIAASVACK